MFILEKKAEPEQQIWDHIKRNYQGEKVAVVGVKKQMPQTFLRNKQVIFYESLTGRSLVEEGERFLNKFAKDYSAFVFYLDCPSEVGDQLVEAGRKLGVRVTVTVEEKAA
ncbi:hypothetical protein JZO77_18355 [Enterococcus hulanensis]|uniref:hypothetical protein n=1 Tax=Enterococcus TaxID=1350 RepID=UPI000B5AAC32|nr:MULTISPECIES: hypothetical protein [Enterococcus]MBO0411357.1 hypothetical protein [Enterococcus hulanensis]MBO0458701.1 hypothetical protein [Enterococcus hulanensis]OTO21327.1 hypothetical protein A5875_002708 [Enterococcus sp. 3H8_DIV0648]